MEVGDNPLVTAYFTNRETAQGAVEDLQAAGISSEDLVLDDQSTDDFLDGLKRLFGAETAHEQYGSGTLLTVCGHRELAIPILRRYGVPLGF